MINTNIDSNICNFKDSFKNISEIPSFWKTTNNSPWAKPVAAAVAISVGVVAYSLIGSNLENPLLLEQCNRLKKQAVKGYSKSMDELETKWGQGLCLPSDKSIRNAYKAAITKSCQDWERQARKGYQYAMYLLEEAWDRKDCSATDQEKSAITNAKRAVTTRQSKKWEPGARNGYRSEMSQLEIAWNKGDCLASDQEKSSIKDAYNVAITKFVKIWN